MRQYLDIKARYPDAILFFRLGDFYEMFYEDAVFAARTLSLTLTTRDKGKEDPVPMAGVPHHSARGYIERLTELGHRVAVCEQLEDPKLTRGMVKRGVVRVITPGVVLDEESLEPRAPNYVAAVAGEARDGFGLAFADVTTGDFRATFCATTEGLLDELARVEPREILLAKQDSDLAAAIRRTYGHLAQTPMTTADEPAPWTTLGEALGESLDRASLERLPQVATAAARVVRYVRATQVCAPLPTTRLELFRRDDFLVIDEQARAHLELVETMVDRRPQGSLLHLLDATVTAMGARLLRRWLLFPLVDIVQIRRRQDAVERLVAQQSRREAARELLGELGDIERLTTRARLGVASPRDLAVLGRSLARLPELRALLRQATDGLPAVVAAEAESGGLLDLGTDLGADLAERIGATLRDDAPATTKDGGYVKPGVSSELDEVCVIASGGREGILAIEARERERTGIPTLKVKYNSVFGYFIEVTRSRLGNVPPEYTRKQTVANAERFVTPELAEYEAKILTADERRTSLELSIFTKLRDEVGEASERLLALAGRVARADVLAALAEQAHRHDYCRPLVDDSEVVELVASRHPVVERLAAAGGFVPNDVRLDTENEQMLLVTGPNMAGKSTLIRQVALAVIMAQMGGFVPARQARIGLCDRVLSRVGAGDNLARGESTFLLEMRETAHILRHATRKSLIILDEIGRGTSTYDGVSIAWAVAEHLHDRVAARTLFATHYHELCALAETHGRVRNMSVAAREWQGEVVFLRKLTPGGTSRSFGIEVARLAGLPETVVARARAILGHLEEGGPGGKDAQPRLARPEEDGRSQLSLFAPPSSREAVRQGAAGAEAEVLAALRAVDLDGLSPRAAWDLLAELGKKLTSAH
ncbi:MAG: DNA mismatch repair protein MutS [Deltaproteobacteria bacterium]|nr:DNA mismatch repair protein MutS [Deltaproteobacteria bacterium]